MFKQFLVLSAAIVALALAAPVTEQEAKNELISAGMSEIGVNVLVKLDNDFKAEYPSVAGNKEASDKFIADFQANAEKVINSMSPQDQDAYKAHINKYMTN